MLKQWRTGVVRHPDLLAVLGIVLVVLAANLPYVSGRFVANPLVPRSGLETSFTLGPLRGGNVLDPNDGYVSQALGHRAALDLLSGQLPWWDPYEGAGAPLAGEMQSASLFPPTLLLALGDGQLLEQLLLEALAGIGTYFLLRRLGVSRVAGFAGGAAFALNGTFAWFAHAPINPVPFLPWLLLGLERAHSATRRDRSGGWRLTALAVALSLLAGFPETAYIDGLLAVLWLGWRLVGSEPAARKRLLGKAAGGLVVGLLLAAPLLIAFANALRDGFTGSHAGFAGGLHLPAQGLSQLMLPYVYGPLLAFQDAHGVLPAIWGRVGGYLTATLVLLAILGLSDRSRRGLTAVLGVWLLLGFARVYGVPTPLAGAVGVLPGMNSIYFFRYALPSLELAAVILAALGIDRLRAGSRRPILAASAISLALLGTAALTAHGLVVHLDHPASHSRWARAAVMWGGAVILAVALLGAVRTRPRLRAGLACALMILDCGAMFAVRELSAPRSVTADFTPVNYLRRHLGLQRFFTLGPIQPQYGAYFSLASVNDDDVPLPTAWVGYVNHRLDPVVNPLVFVGNSGGERSPTLPSPTQELLRHLDGYRAAAVAYVLTPPGSPLPPARGLVPVSRSPGAWIYRLSGSQPYFSSGGHCRLRSLSRQRLRISCAQPSELTRRELSFPGWSVTIDSQPAPLGHDGVFQRVQVPRGDHIITFAYAPPGIAWGWLGLGIGLALLALGGPAMAWIGRRRGARRKGSAPANGAATVRA